ncbi:cytoplasmic incompatibility factor CifB [Wolbachia endosymbiont (group A) of Norellia spinipes]|uniref:cytoplasmic incompatibility factor CifB n=1 Tax=Wolbachia endosymbiont (group A) of Norellia spinipes TaxID=3066150 RepID=UPI0036DA07FE
MNNGDGFIRSLVNKNLEGFRREFESFLDQCPSFLYHVGTGRFLPVFFFSMFATAHDAGILAPDERVYIRFDNHGIDTDGRNRSTGNLKVAVLTNKSLGKKRVVRCYSISDVPNSDGLRFSEREKNSLVQEIGRENRDLREEGLSFEQYKVCTHGKGKSQGEKGAVVFEEIREKDSRGGDRFAKYSASEINLIRVLLENHELTIKEIEGMDLNQNQHGQLDELVNFVQIAPGQQRIDNFAEMLRSGVVRTLRDNSTVIFRYITRIYRNYAGTLENDIQDRNQKFESHGFLLGFLANFSHLCTIDIDLNLSLVNSYVAFLVHHQAERENIPIVINIGWRTLFALEHARGDAQRLHASSFISIHTESRHAVCVGLNFNSHLTPFRVGIAERQQNRFPLVQRLFECVEDEGIRENVRDFLLQHFPIEIPRNAENHDRILDYIIGFAFGNSAVTREYLELREGEDQVRLKKYIFRYNNEDLRRHALTMVFHAQGFPIVILDIRNPHDIRSVKAISLPPGYDGAVNRVTYILNNQYGLNVLLDRFNSPDSYLRRSRYTSYDGNLIGVPNAENVHNTLNQVMNDGWQGIAQHRELLRAISRVLVPDNMNGNAIIDVSNNDKFRSILHGIFYVCNNPDKVVTEYRVGQTYSPDIRMAGEVSTRAAEHRLDLLLLRQPTENDSDTHPIGYVLGFADNEEEVEQEQDEARYRITELMSKQRGYLPITSGNEVVLFPIVFNRGANEAGNLILFPEGIGREEYVHRFDRRSRSLRPGRIVRPVALNSILPLINTYIQNNPNGAFGQLRDVHDILTLDFATDNCNYHYWLQDEDIRYAARAQRYNLPHDEGNILFNVIREQDIHDQLQGYINYRGVQVGEILISNLIINTGRSHWVTLVIVYQNGNYYGYYANSLGGNVPDQLNTLRINNVPVPVHNVLADQEGNLLVQQEDGYNCGIWVLENARSINQILQQNNNLGEQGRGVLGEIRNSLTLNVPGLNNIVDQNNLRNEQYFQNLRREISREFRNTGTNAGHDRDNNPQIRGAIRLQNQNEIRELLLNFLELQYPAHRIWQQQPPGGGGGMPILSIGDSDNRELLKELEQPKNDKMEARQEAEERKCEGIKQNKNLILNASDANKTVNDARLSGIKSFESQGVSTMLSDANVSGVSTRLGRY